MKYKILFTFAVFIFTLSFLSQNFKNLGEKSNNLTKEYKILKLEATKMKKEQRLMNYDC